MTQDEYKLFTGESVNFQEADWERLVSIAEMRLVSFLCLDEWPSEAPDGLKMLLANFMAAVFAYQGSNGPIQSKSVRNFSIHFQSAEAKNAFEKVFANYSDLVEIYSNCGSTLKVECSVRHCDECF